jgi:formamidopyrimidine-DNA glycosylase
MPELPEVETIRRGLETAILRKTIKRVQINRADLRAPIPKNFIQTIEKQRVVSTQRRGKYILVFCEGGQGFVMHLGMSGRISIFASKKEYTAGKHDHAVFELEDGTHIVFNDPRRFGMLYLTSEKKWQSEAPFQKMGPEPLEKKFTGEVLAEKLKGKRGPIKTVLLDQNVVAGIGNIYACEALFESQIHPQQEAGTISRRFAGKLAASLQNVLQKSLKAGGSTLKDYAHTDGSLGYFQAQFGVYDREGLACASCRCDIVKTGGVKRMIQAGRSTFYCPHRQKPLNVKKGKG